MYNWEKQFELIRQGVAFVRATTSSNGAEPFDVVVRMRMVRIRNKNCPAPSAFSLSVSAWQTHRSPHAPCLPCLRTCSSLSLGCFRIAQSQMAL
jgi:hypothetical protein